VEAEKAESNFPFIFIPRETPLLIHPWLLIPFTFPLHIRSSECPLHASFSSDFYYDSLLGKKRRIERKSDELERKSRRGSESTSSIGLVLLSFMRPLSLSIDVDPTDATQTE